MTSPTNATTTDAGRSYLWPPTSEVFPSVTTILSGGTPTPPQLQRWIAETNAWHAVETAREWLPVAEVDPRGVVAHLAGAADRKRDEAADRGTLIHSWAEAIAKGEAKGCPPPEIAGYVEAFQEFLDDWMPRYLHLEASVFNRTLGYAGTFDWLADLNGRLVLGDIKTKLDGKKMYGTSIRLQLAAYRRAEWIGIGDKEVPMPATEGAVALVLYPSHYDLIPVQADEEAWEAFCAALTVYRFCQASGASLGERMVAG